MTVTPVVGLPKGRAPEERYSMHRGYVSSLAACRAVPVLLPAGSDAHPHALCAVVDHCHSIVVAGGDVDPGYCGAAEPNAPEALMQVDPGGDNAEVVVVQYAVARGMLRATDWSPDGVVEAVEGRTLLGVQWHPERLTATDPRHLAPFEWVVQG